MSTAINVVDAKNRFSDLLRRAEYGSERVVVHRHGRPVAAIVSTADLERLESLEDAEDVADASAALQEAKAKGLIPLEVVLKKHGLGHLLSRRAPRHRKGRGRTEGASDKRPRSRGRVPRANPRQGKRRTR